MSAKEDLQTKIQSLQDKLFAARESLHALLIDEYPRKVGEKVEGRNGEEFTISSVIVRYGTPIPFGKKTLKNGQLGWQEIELYWLDK